MILDELQGKPEESATERAEETGTDVPESRNDEAEPVSIWERFDLGGEG